LKLKAIAGIVLIFLLITVTFTLLSISVPSLVGSYVQVFQGGSTEVEGYISKNTTWTSANSPYIVTGDVTVVNWSTLTIESGVTVKFTDKKSLVITSECSLIAQGTIADNIVFTSNKTEPNKGDWGMVWFLGKNFVMSYALIEYATTGVKFETTAGISNSIVSNCNVGVEGKLSYADNLTVTGNTGDGLSLSTPLRIKNSNVSSNGGHGITTTDTIDMDNCVVWNNTEDGIILSKGESYIKNSRITDNDGNGTCILGPTTIENTTISENGVNGSGNGIWTESSISITECNITKNEENGIRVGYVGGSITIQNSNISDNTGDGIWTNSFVQIKGCHIAYNGGNGVITAENGNMKVNGSDIRNNTLSGLLGRGYVSYSTVSGNNMSGISGNFTIEVCNVITENKGGGFNGTGRIFWSDIFNNTLWGSYDAIADIWPNNITAINNWWGTNDSAIIEEHIWDHNDNESLGYVFFEPYLQGPHGPLDIWPPKIGLPIYNGTSPSPYLNRTELGLDFPIRTNEPVRVSVNVTDNESPMPSGVDRVLLFYRVNSSEWWNTTMTLITMYNETSGNWNVTIPAQPANSTVEFFIQAYDKAGNWNMSSTYSYTVKWLTLGDINGDGKTDMKDIYIVARNFGKKDP